MNATKLAILLSLLLGVGLFGLGCGDDDDNDAAGDADVDGDADGDADGDSDGDSDADVLVNYTGTVIGFGSDTPVPDMTVIALENGTAEEIEGHTQTSGADGSVVFDNLPVDDEGLVGFKVVGVPTQFVDTYQFNIIGDQKDDTLYHVDFATYTMAPAIAGIVVDKKKAIAAGAVYFRKPNGDEEPVGCATVEPVSGEAEIRYFGDNDLPAPVEEQESVNPGNGYFIGANMTPGKVTLQALIDGEVIGTSTFHAFPGEAISIGNIIVDESITENPGTCE